MASNIEEILGKQINSVKELRAEIKRLQDSLINIQAGTQEYNETTEKLVSAQELLNNVTKAGTKEMQASATSIVGLEKEYKKLYNAYKLLSEEERNSDFGSQMANRLKEVSEQLNDTKKNVGNFKDNIGHYSESAIDAFSKMGISVGGLIQPLTNVKGAFGLLNKTMLANPVMWLLGALMLLKGIFDKVKDAIAGNEESQMKLNVAMANFQPIIDAVSNAFDYLGQKVVDSIGVIGKAYTKVREFGAGLTDFLGITKGAKEDLQETTQLYTELAQRKNDLTKLKRENIKLNALQEEELKTLLTEAEATSNQVEQLEKLNRAKQLQEEITQRQVKEAEEEFEILKNETSLTANDAETNDRLAEAEAKLNRIKAEGASKTKEMTTKIRTLTEAKKKDNKETEESVNLAKEQLKAEEDQIKAIEERFKSEEQKLTEQYNTELKLLKKHNKDTTQLTSEYNAKIAEIRQKQRDDEAQQAEDNRRKQIEDYEFNKNKEYNDKYIVTAEYKTQNPEDYLSIKTQEIGLSQLRMKQIQDELQLEQLSVDEKIALYEEYYNILSSLMENEKRSKEELYNINMNNASSVISLVDAVGSLSKAIGDNIQRELESGKISEAQAKKKKKALKDLEAVQLAVSLATIAGDTAMGIVSLWTAFAKKKVANTQLINPVAIASANAVDLATTIVQTTALATMASAQMAGAIGGYISNVNAITGSESTSSVTPNTVTPNTIDSTGYTYTRNLQTDEEKENEKKIVVYVDDIKRALDNRNKVNVETTF